MFESKKYKLKTYFLFIFSLAFPIRRLPVFLRRSQICYPLCTFLVLVALIWATANMSNVCLTTSSMQSSNLWISLNTTFQMQRLDLQLSRYCFGFRDPFQSTFSNGYKIQVARLALCFLTLLTGSSFLTAKNKNKNRNNSKSHPLLLLFLFLPPMSPPPTPLQIRIVSVDAEETNSIVLHKFSTTNSLTTFGHSGSHHNHSPISPMAVTAPIGLT